MYRRRRIAALRRLTPAGHKTMLSTLSLTVARPKPVVHESLPRQR